MYNSYKKTKTLPDVPKISEDIHPIKVDFSLLTDILSQRRHSKSPLQDEFLTEVAIKLEEKGATAETDEYGNLYITKGKGPLYPCAVAHVDINQTVRNNVRIYRNDKWIFGFDLDEAVQCGLGADDGVGVYFALEMFDRFENFKIFFAKDEEIG